MGRYRLRLHLSVLLLSAALIGFQLELMQVLAHMQFYHFGYLVISIALLGFGASGSCIALFRQWLLDRFDQALPTLMFGCSTVMSLSLPLSQKLIGSFDLSLLFIGPSQFFILLLCQLLFFLIFFLGALAIGLIFIQYSIRISSLYFANMIGSGIGGICIVLLMIYFLPEKLVQFIALLPWLGGCLLLPKKQLFHAIFAFFALCIIVSSILFPFSIQPSNYKSIRRTLDLPDATILLTKPSPFGVLQLVRAQALRSAPGLSLAYDKSIPELKGVVFINGDQVGSIHGTNTSFFQASLQKLPYIFRTPEKILDLHSGTGSNIQMALSHHPTKITAVEPNTKIVDLLKQLSGTTNPYDDPKVQTSRLHPRTWLAADNLRYDLITIPKIGSFGGSAGLFAMQEHYLLTAESFTTIWEHLTPDGLFFISTWVDSPLRAPLRLAATIAELLEQKSSSYQNHLLVVRSWDMVCFLIKRSPFTGDEIARLQSFIGQYQFDLIFPINANSKSFFHSAGDDPLIQLTSSIFDPTSRAKLYQEYDFDIGPVTDYHPFFSQFLRMSSFSKLTELLGRQTLPFLELGYFIVILSLGQMVFLSICFILLPLLKLGSVRKLTPDWSTTIYFMGLGLGYMFFEIALIHELVLYLGHPIFGAAAAIGCLLILSGLGSLFSDKIHQVLKGKTVITALIVSLFLFYSYFLPTILHQTIGLPIVIKVCLTVLLIGTPAFLMGMPFPLGLKQVAKKSGKEAAWAWGINGSASVVATGLATIIAVEMGFTVLLVAAAGCYGMVMLSSRRSA